jgi:GNAT superfamily N-acetyltransferase
LTTAPPGYRIRVARPGDVQALAEIERRAGELFRTVGLDMVADGFSPPLDDYRRAITAGTAWLAETVTCVPAGFVIAGVLDGVAHLVELDVDPDHGRRGLGRALVATVVAWARSRALPEVVLTTFRDVPFNGPFYVAQGFVEFLPGADRPGLLAARAHEAAIGFDAASPRIAMRLPL